MKKWLIALLALVLLGLSCDEGDDPVTPTVNPYAGEWTLTIAGGVNYVGTLVIADDGTFADTMVITSGGTPTTLIHSGTVTEAGVATGQLLMNGLLAGTTTGNFAGAQGSGTWDITAPTPMTGTWTATKGATHPFMGKWAIVLAGDITGGGDINIANNGAFADNWTLTVGGTAVPVTFAGSVANDGALSGSISSGGVPAGTSTGTLSGNSGNGDWQITVPTAATGTWTATKQ